MVAIVDARDHRRIANAVDAVIDELEKSRDSMLQAAAIAAACSGNKNLKTQLSKLSNAVLALKPSRDIASLLGSIQLTDEFRAAAQPMEIGDDWIQLDAKSTWYMHDDHLTLPSLPAAIMYRYPIVGDFRLRYEQLGTKPNDDSTIGYDGQNVEFFWHWREGVNQRTVDSKNGLVRFWSNGHPVGAGSTNTSSPWLTIAFRVDEAAVNSETLLSADRQTIPHVVNLISDDNIRGWKTYRAPELYGATDEFNQRVWSVDAGVLQSIARRPTTARTFASVYPTDA